MYSRSLSHWYRVSSILKNVNNMDCDPLLWWLLLSQLKYDGKFILNSVDYILDVPCTKYCSDPFIRIRVRANRNFHRIWRDLNYIGVIVSEKEPLGYFSQSCKCFRVILFNTRQTHLSCHLGPPCNGQQDCSYHSGFARGQESVSCGDRIAIKVSRAEGGRVLDHWTDADLNITRTIFLNKIPNYIKTQGCSEATLICMAHFPQRI